MCPKGTPTYLFSMEARRQPRNTLAKADLPLPHSRLAFPSLQLRLPSGSGLHILSVPRPQVSFVLALASGGPLDILLRVLGNLTSIYAQECFPSFRSSREHCLLREPSDCTLAVAILRKGLFFTGQERCAMSTTRRARSSFLPLPSR